MPAFSADNVILLVIAGVQALTAYLAYRTKMDIAEVKVHTNSMKDALVESVGKEQFQLGKDKGAQEGKETAATLAQGQLMGKEQQINSNAPIPQSPAAPVEVEVVKTTPVDVKKSVPVEIKQKAGKKAQE